MSDFAFVAEAMAGKLARFLGSQEAVLEWIGQEVEDEVHRRIGRTDAPEWAPLSDTTIDLKRQRGHGRGGDPFTILYATGAFDRDVSHHVDAKESSVSIGTNEDYIVYTENGTVDMPPRPVFLPSAHAVLPSLLGSGAFFTRCQMLG